MKNEILKNSSFDDKIAKLKKEMSESLAVDRHFLIYNFPFTAAISMRMNLIPVRDKRLSTACTDGKNIFFDCDFYSKLTKPERTFVLAHEIWHCVMMHLSRCQTRNKQLFNIATDMEVNNLLVENTKDKDKSIVPPKDLLFPPENLKGKSAETIYEYLLKKHKNDKNQSGNKTFDGSGSKGSGSDSSESSKSSKTDNKLSGQFDKHVYEDNEDDGGENDKVFDTWGEVGYDKDFKPYVPDDIAEQMREAIVSAAQQVERTIGKLPAAIESIIEKIKKPEIDWKDELANFVTSAYGDGRKWLPPNRRYVYNEIYMQSRRTEKIHGVVAIDTSGSCIGDLPKFFGELKGLVDSFGSYHITTICADAAVDQVDEYDSNDNPLEFETAENIKWSGGGGTDYGPVFEHLDKEGICPDFLIYIGDGFANMSYTKQPTYPVLWLLTKDGNTDFCSWGKKIKFKNSSYDY